MTTPAGPRARKPEHGLLQAKLSAQLALRQFLLLFVTATALLFILFFFNYCNAMTFASLWDNLPPVTWKFLSIPLILVIVYGYVILNGLIFSLGSSERSYNVFFGVMVMALMVVNYDHSLIDWILAFTQAGAPVKVECGDPRPINALKILFATPFFLALAVMHYNILADDFMRRMIRRGVPTQEVFQIRRGVFQVLVPTMLIAGAVAFGLALLGHLGDLIFGDSSLHFSKIQIVVLAVLIVPMAFLLRSILRDLAASKEKPRPPGPNR